MGIRNSEIGSKNKVSSVELVASENVRQFQPPTSDLQPPTFNFTATKAPQPNQLSRRFCIGQLFRLAGTAANPPNAPSDGLCIRTDH